MRHRAILILIAALASGCVSDSNHARQTPAGVRPTALAITVGDFQDSDLNLYRDRTTAVVYVCSDSPAYPIPIKTSGAFEFRLQRHDGSSIATWNFDEKQTAAALHQLAPGPGYVFELNLAKIGKERIPDRDAEILCTFTPTGGEPIRGHPSAPLLVGPVGANQPDR